MDAWLHPRSERWGHEQEDTYDVLIHADYPRSAVNYRDTLQYILYDLQ